jgi:hypothetical protein
MITSHFEIEPLILAIINGLALTGIKTVGDESVVAGLTSYTGLLPAAILYSGDGSYSDGTVGGIQTETQYWQLSVMVPHIKSNPAGTTASRAGQYFTPVLAALVGQQLTADFAPLEIVERPEPVYLKGYAEFSVILKTSFEVGPNA